MADIQKIRVVGTDYTLKARAIVDAGDSTEITLAYSKAGLAAEDYTWLAGWNGRELRAVAKSQFAAAGHTHNYLPLAGGTMTGSINWKSVDSGAYTEYDAGALISRNKSAKITLVDNSVKLETPNCSIRCTSAGSINIAGQTAGVTIPTLGSTTLQAWFYLTQDKGGISFGPQNNSNAGHTLTAQKNGGWKLIAQGAYIQGVSSKLTFVSKAWDNGTGTSCYIDTDGQLVKYSSSIRYKTAIDYELDPDKYHNYLMKLKPCTYEYKEERYQPNLGLIAEDVYDVNPDFVNFDENFEIESFKDRDIMTLLIMESQRKDKEVEELKQKNEELESRLAALEDILKSTSQQ